MTADEFASVLSETERAFHFGAWLRTTGSKTLVWSPGMYRLLGLHPTVPASDELLVKATHPDDQHFQLRTLRRAPTDMSIESTKFRIRRADGSYFEAHCYVRSLEGSDSRPRQQLGVCFENSACTQGHLVSRQLLEAFGPVDALNLPQPDQQHAAPLDTSDPLISLNVALIRAARGLLNWSYEDLAEACGLSYSTIRRVENETLRTVRPETVRRVRRTFEERGIMFVKIGTMAGVVQTLER